MPGDAADSGSVEAATISIAGGGAAPACGGGFIGWQVTQVFPPLLGWVQASQAQSVSGKMEGMVDGCAGGGEVALQITGVQKQKGEGKNLACGRG